MYDVAVDIARMRVVPLVRTETRHEEQREADGHVRDQHRDPDFKRQRPHEREQGRRLVLGSLEQNADPEVHEWIGEVDDAFTYEAD